MEKIFSHVGTQSTTASQLVLRKTYFMLALTITFSALTAMVSMHYHLPAPGLVFMLIGFYGLMFLTNKFADKPAGIICAFAFTGFLGYSISPIISHYLAAGMGDTVAIALAGTAVVFFCCSAYVLISKRDMSFLSGMLMAGTVVLLIGIVLNLFLHLPALQMTLSVLFILFSSAALLWQTSSIIQGGETSYIRATVGIYVSMYNIFVSLLSLLGMSSRNN